MVAGLAAAAGAYYFYYGKDAKKHREVVVDWSEKARQEIVSKVGKLGREAIREENYTRIVATVAEKYRKLRKLKKSEVDRFTAAFVSGWMQFQKEFAKKETRRRKT